MANHSSSYLQYLDKEITITGILCSFCVVLVAVALDRVGAAQGRGTLFSQVHDQQLTCVLLGCAAVLIAAGFFAKQRSDLAWLYGQISLSQELGTSAGWDTKGWYAEADSWTTWTPNRWAFTSLTIGILLYSYAIVAATVMPFSQKWIEIPVAAWIAFQMCRFRIYKRYKYKDDPIREFLKQFRR